MTTGVGCFFDEKITKNERNTITSWIRPPQGPSLVGTRHAGYIYKFQKSYVFEKKRALSQKNKTRLPRGRRPLRDPLLLAPIMRDTIRNSFEGGGVALPDYSSREGCRVEVQDSRKEGRRVFS